MKDANIPLDDILKNKIVNTNETARNKTIFKLMLQQCIIKDVEN